MEPIYEYKTIFTPKKLLVLSMNLMTIKDRPVEEILENWGKVYDCPCPRHSLEFGTYSLLLYYHF